MSYLVLARRYRPQAFKEVIGQTHVIRTLTNALKHQKLSHALLFSGIKGTGKTTVARIIAKSLNCLNLIDNYEPCNQCSNCIEINKGVFVDVIEIDAASNRGIEQIRELIENLKFSPAKGKSKVYIIDEAHMLTREASNALLKSLEEPPSHVYFILATTEPNKLLPTILSRCQRYDFRRLENPLIVKYLKKVCEQENYEIEESALNLIAKASQGSLRDALSLLDQAMAYGIKSKEDVISAFGWHETLLIEELACVLLEKNFKKVLKVIQKVYEQGIDLIYLMEKLTEFFKELLVIKAFPKESKIDFQSSGLRDLVFETELEDILLIFQSLVKDLEILRKSSYPQLQFEMALFKICEYGKLVPLKEIVEKLNQISNTGFSFSLPDTSSEKPSKEKTWENFVEEIKKENLPLYGLVSNLPIPQIKENEIYLKISSLKNFTDSPYYQLLKEKIESYFNKPLKIEIEEEKRVTLEDVKERPEVKEILKIFSAKIAYIQPLKE